MNRTRRGFFSALLTLPVAVVAPRASVAPLAHFAARAAICPDCGLHAYIEGHKPHGEMWDVSCSCGWRGKFPQSIPVPR